MRVVIDTNVLISAALKQASMPARAVAVAEQRAVILKSRATERQVAEVLGRPKLSTLIPAGSAHRVRRLMEQAEVVEISTRVQACRDPTDDKFLELAVAGRARFIISGDGDLLALHPFRGIRIVTPALFCALVP